MQKYDVCIIGGGASGLVAAIRVKDLKPDASVVVLEKLWQVGRKVAASGNGRCNLSNVECPDWERTSAFFSNIGLLTRIDEAGRIYPYSEDGRDVVNLLKKACEARGVEIMMGRPVTRLQAVDSGGFKISADFNKPKAYRPKPEDVPIELEATCVLIATGGKSKPEFGTTGDGYSFARELGHSVTPLIPALTGIMTEEDTKGADLTGIRQKALVVLKDSGNIVFQDQGEVQFTDYGLSGICIFDMSRFLEGKDFSKYTIEVDFVPEIGMDELYELVLQDGLTSIVKGPIAKVIKDKTFGSDEPWVQLKGLTFHPNGLRGWDMAQVTKGGVPLSEVDEHTGESSITPGIFFSGEMLDVDFRCGGFNLQNAWSSGLRAAEGMVARLDV